MLVSNKKHSCSTKNFSASNFINKLATLTAFGAACLFIAPTPAHALIAVADTTNSYPGIGYGAIVLDSLLDSWKNPDPKAEGVTSVTLRIAKDGRPFSCEIRRSSSSQITDTSICDAVAHIGTFPAPTSVQNTEIILTFMHDNKNEKTEIQNTEIQNTENSMQDKKADINTDKSLTTQSAVITHVSTPALQELDALDSSKIQNQASTKTVESPDNTTIKENSVNKVPTTTPMVTDHQEDVQITREEALSPPSADLVLPAEAMKEYSQNVFKQAASLINVPMMPDGTYKTIVRVDIDPKGRLKKSTVQTSSGASKLDNEILRVLREEIKYPSTPHNDHQSIWLTFIIQK